MKRAWRSLALAAAIAAGADAQALNPGGSPPPTTSGLACAANTVVAGPASGPAATVGCRGLTVFDLPSLGFSNLSGIIALAQIPSTISSSTSGNAATATAALGLSVVVAAPSNLPATCSTGQLAYVVTTTPGIYACSATNTWTLQGGGGGGGGGGGAGAIVPVFSDSEVPTGTVNGLNNVFTLAYTPNPTTSVILTVNGLVMKQGNDYTLSGTTVLFATASIPQTGDLVLAWYQAGWSPAPPSTNANANTVLAGPTSGSAAPGQFRLLVAADLPSSFNAPTATALANAGTQCGSGQAPQGVDAHGNAQNCQAVGGGSSGFKVEAMQNPAVTVTNTTSATTLASFTLPASELGNLQRLSLEGAGYWSATGSQTHIIVTVSIGGTAVWTENYGTWTQAFTNQSFQFTVNCLAMAAAGASVAVDCQGTLLAAGGHSSSADGTVDGVGNTSTFNLATSSSNTVLVTAQWGVADASSVTLTQFEAVRKN